MLLLVPTYSAFYGVCPLPPSPPLGPQACRARDRATTWRTRAYTFIEFIETGKKPKKITNAKITEDVGGAPAAGAFSAPQASLTNTPGMGNVSAPGPGIIGSGDKFGEDDEDEDEVKNQHGIVSYEQFKKKFLTSGKSNKQ